MRTTSSIQFYCRKSKVGKTGYAPLEVSITLSGERKFLNLPMKFRPEDFNKKRPSEEIITALDLWRTKINDYTLQIMKSGQPLTTATLKEVIQSGGVRAYSVGKLFEDFLSIQKRRIGVDLRPTVYRKYELVCERVLEFISKDADVTKLTPRLIKEIEVTWKSRYDPSTVCGYLTRFKCVIRFAIDNGKLQINPFQNIRIVKPIKPIKALEESRVIELLSLSLEPRLQRVLDCFLVQCGTGMAYADLVEFKIEDLKRIGDFYYISKKRVKTGKTFSALVFPWAVNIILHYKRLPVISNQKMNKFLKSISPELTTHMGRRTYASILANRNVSPSVVASALGDDVAIALKYYCKILPQTIINEQIKCLGKNH